MFSARNASVVTTFNFEPYYNNHKLLEYSLIEKKIKVAYRFENLDT
jgi:hypothetical protein